MLELLKKMFQGRHKQQEELDPDALVLEKWEAPLNGEGDLRFDIKPESSYDAYLQGGALVLGLLKANCMAWIEDPLFSYGDFVLEGRFRLESSAYAAAGFMFRAVDDETHYTALVSNRGYFRLDVLRNGMPLTLIGWTEIPGLPENEKPGPITLKIIAHGERLLLAVNGNWAAEVRDATIASGRFCFTAVCYDAPPGEAGAPTVTAFLEAFSVDSQIGASEEALGRWEAGADPASRVHLAETFTAMGQPAAALAQLERAWEDPAWERTQRELLLAARLALQLGLMEDAGAHIEACIAAGAGTPLGREAAVERAKLLYLAGRYDELLAQEGGGGREDSTLLSLQGHVHLHRGDHERAALAYDRAGALDGENGLFFKNAANAYELWDKKDEAVKRYLKAGDIFLSQDNYGDLGILVPKLLALDGSSWEAHGLAGKWAFGIEDWALAEKEFDRAEELRLEKKPRPRKDPSLVFLRGLILARAGKRRDALVLLEEAARLAPDIALFRFRLAEHRFLLSGSVQDPQLQEDMAEALRLAGGEPSKGEADSSALETAGWIHNLAAQIALGNNNLKEASDHLEKAAQVLGEVPAIRVNRAALSYLSSVVDGDGSAGLDRALAMLEVRSKDEDPQGILANCAGNLLVREGRFEEAGGYYRAALAAAPHNAGYICNRASCLIELGSYGEADTLLAAIETMDTPVLNLIAYVASKKGEYPRAEAACKNALELEPGHVPSLLSLGWIYMTQGREEDLRDLLRRLSGLALSKEEEQRRAGLARRLEESLTKTFSCSGCGRTWRVPKNAGTVPSLRLFAMPPDELPAGSCPECGKVYCIGCGKNSLDGDGRFLCPGCGKTLKLTDRGLKQLIHDWAVKAFPEQAGGKAKKRSGKK